MPGWMVQRYVNVPAVVIAMGELVVPAPRLGVANRFASCVALCVIESAFRHATLCPTRIICGSGEKDWLPRFP